MTLLLSTGGFKIGDRGCEWRKGRGAKHQSINVNSHMLKSNHRIYGRAQGTSLPCPVNILRTLLPHLATPSIAHFTPNTRNCSVMTNPTRKNMTNTPSGHASKATSARNNIRQNAERNVQMEGTRAESEKKKYDPEISRARVCTIVRRRNASEMSTNIL